MVAALPFRSLAVLAFVAFTGVALAQPPIDRNLRVNIKCEISTLPPDAKTVDFWVPVPPTNERQKAKLLNEDELGAGRFTEDKVFGNRLYYRRF